MRFVILAVLITWYLYVRYLIWNYMMERDADKLSIIGSYFIAIPLTMLSLVIFGGMATFLIYGP